MPQLKTNVNEQTTGHASWSDSRTRLLGHRALVKAASRVGSLAMICSLAMLCYRGTITKPLITPATALKKFDATKY